ncbi:MAG: 16S rRNA (adenine(1518)-N(6)/adenine(1519)-N(6))-dimethyltransferase RsmA [Planctomycetaceae bacterium]
MTVSERQTRSQLMALFSGLGWHPRGDLGQNFLIDLNLMEYLVAQARLDARDVAFEVGAGTGGLTNFLARHAGHVVSVEIDPRVHGLARSAIAACNNVTLLLGDALRSKHHLATAVVAAIDRELRVAPDRRLKLVANLPYSVATPVISNLIASEWQWQLMVATIQWELAERLRARPGTHDYGALSVWIQSQCEVEVLKKVGPQVFWPRPQVDSAIVRIVPKAAGRQAPGDRAFFQEFLRKIFTQRRKLLRSALVGVYRNEVGKGDVEQVLSQCGVPPGARAEELEVEMLVGLAGALKHLVCNRS